MNKKFYIGTLAVGIAASFWACGSGEIIKPNEFDGTMGYPDEEDPTMGIDAGAFKAYCPECVAQVSSSSTAPKTQKSSSSRQTLPGLSSSSKIVINTSSSAEPGIASSSSQSGPVFLYSSSSSAPVVQPGGDVGTCAPEKDTYESGESVIWKFERGSAITGQDYLKSKSVWTTADGTPAASEVLTGVSGRTHKVTYATSGKHNASVQITTATGAVHNVTCTPVQVNGAPITGCKCVAAEKNPDISVGGAWTISGCSSTGANIVGYEWAGALADPTNPAKASQAFTAKNQAAAPIVSVSNDDNTVIQVPCDTVVSVDANDPDYPLTFEGSSIPSAADVSIDIPLNKEACIQVSFKWEGGWTPNNISLLCDVTAAQNQPGLTLDITYGETSKSYPGDYNISNSGIALGAVKTGQNTMNNVCVTATGKEGGKAKCFFGN